MKPLGQTASIIVPLLVCFGLAACEPYTAQQALPSDASAQTTKLAVVKDDLDSVSHKSTTVAQKANPATTNAIIGMGFSQVSNQPGKTTNQKRILAIRAARVEAMRDLTEQVHGLRISSSTTIKDAMVVDDVLRGKVDGEIRGARTVRITPKGGDGYEVVLALDTDMVRYIVKAARGH